MLVSAVVVKRNSMWFVYVKMEIVQTYIWISYGFVLTNGKHWLNWAMENEMKSVRVLLKGEDKENDK